MPIPDCATLKIAQDKGYFSREGLKVDASEIQSGGLAFAPLQGGSLDISIGNYVSTIAAQAQGAGPFQFLNDAYQAAPGTFVVMVPKTSKAQELKDLRGKRIAVAALHSIITLGVENGLATAGLKASDVQMVPMALPQMIAAAVTGQVDAVVLVEPFISAFATQHGAREIYDLMSGSMANFPIAGWMTTVEFAKKNPKTVAAFQRAMEAAQADAARDPDLVENAIPKYTRIEANIASNIRLGTFPVSLEPIRIQRVADRMKELGYLDTPMDVTLLLAGSGATPAVKAS
ncbi:ABC transporter substrate-binding protein [Sphaerisporangium flaviroseum]|uniref:ABC transporter substrate-binding protein n=2 Tax=Sphaerisporangium flaviroseum TaxID=509199 RepID=A0ABP7JFP6_9ACTN